MFLFQVLIKTRVLTLPAVISNPGEAKRLSGRERVVRHVRPPEKGDGMDKIILPETQKIAQWSEIPERPNPEAAPAAHDVSGVGGKAKVRQGNGAIRLTPGSVFVRKGKNRVRRASQNGIIAAPVAGHQGVHIVPAAYDRVVARHGVEPFHGQSCKPLCLLSAAHRHPAYKLEIAARRRSARDIQQFQNFLFRNHLFTVAADGATGEYEPPRVRKMHQCAEIERNGPFSAIARRNHCMRGTYRTAMPAKVAFGLLSRQNMRHSLPVIGKHSAPARGNACAATGTLIAVNNKIKHDILPRRLRFHATQHHEKPEQKTSDRL
jgi:hypothetical protein